MRSKLKACWPSGWPLSLIVDSHLYDRWTFQGGIGERRWCIPSPGAARKVALEADDRDAGPNCPS